MALSIRLAVMASCAALTAHHAVFAQQSAASSSTKAPTSSGDLDEIVVNGIKRGELVLPTQVSSSSAYGLDLGVMDTPRNNTLLSKAQLDALNIQNPGGFSYLTSSSYSDASFGAPNVPKIRGQYADMFFNGMRDSFTTNGYGAPVSFNSVDSIDIVKGTASVQGGPGSGVGGAIDITTKMPSFDKLQGTYELEFDTQQKRRASFDINDPVTSNVAVRVSFASDDSGSYYNNMWFHQQSLFVSTLTQLNSQYSVLITGAFEDTTYRENDGVNRVNQGLIDNGAYLTGAPPASTISNFLTPVYLSGAATNLSDKVLIDEPGGNGAHALHAKGQIIQTFTASDAFSIVNNTFYDYLDRYNQTAEYYADTAKGSYTIENKTDFKLKFTTGAVANDVDAGFTYRFAHVNSIQNFANEPVGVYDLSASPNTWVFPNSLQITGDAVPYLAAFNHPQYGVPARDSFYFNDSVDSNLKDVAAFLEHQFKFSPEWSALYGLRGDLVQLNQSDPFGGAYLVNGYPESFSTSWYGLYNGNVSVVYTPTEHYSVYGTFNKAQYVLANDNDGAVGTYGESATSQLRQNTLLEELGMKFNLLDKALFISTAIFKQERSVPVGIGGTAHSQAHIKGAEVELNYQPDPHFFMTASYSYLRTLLDSPSGFYNFPAYAGQNYDGAANLIVWNPNQKFDEPGVPKHLFNVLANYKWQSGWGAQSNLQVTGPIATTQSGYIDVAGTNNNASFAIPALVGPGGAVPLSVVAANGYYKAPTIPWQFTLNAAGFYTFDRYTVKLSIYNLTSAHNLQNDYAYYGNDFLTRIPPRSYDLTFTGKF